MNIPYWLLRLLPMWEYICPKCRKGVKQSAHECSHCGERFPLAIRVPPMFLKDPKKLEEYVHKHIFPRVSAFERNYLTKYFTVLFSDGFVSGDFTAWTSTTGSPIIVTSPVHHGVYAMQCDDGDYALKTFTAQNTVYLRFYVYFNTLPTLTDERFIIARIMKIDAEEWLQVYVSRHSGGFNEWWLENRLAGIVKSGLSSTVQINTWYCVEAMISWTGVTTHTELWVNGISILTKDGYITPQTYGTILVGAVYDTGIAEQLVIDCVVAADAYIGPETPKGTIAIHAKLAGII